MPEGYSILTIPADYFTKGDRNKFRDALDLYGFRTLDQYHGVNMGPSKIERYVIQKDHEADNRTLNLTWKGDKVMGGRSNAKI